MAWRTVLIENGARLNCERGQLIVRQQEKIAQVPIEDIDVVIVDSPAVTLTAPLLRALGQSGSVLVVCDAKHMPCGMYLSHCQHSKNGPLVELQIGTTKPLAKRIWQKIVIEKIKNQARLLASASESAAKRLLCYVPKVQSGDSKNVEATAARAYWGALFESPFKRADDSSEINKALDYGYAVLRAALARAVIARGLLPLFGIHHSNSSNAFCLVDDLIEPFRPFVDTEVFAMFESKEQTFEPCCRHRLVNSLYRQVTYAGEEMTLSASITESVSSFVRCLKQSEVSILTFPSL